MIEEKEGTIITLDSMVARERISTELAQTPKGLSIEDLAQICGLKYNTVYQNLRKQFNAQQVVEIRGKEQRLYRLKEYDDAISKISIAYPEAENDRVESLI